MKTWVKAALLGATAALSASAADAKDVTEFDRVVSFGDSLTDNGNLHALFGDPPAPYFDGRFSNGPVWIEQLIGPMNEGIATNNPNGDTNYALGGARADNAANLNGPIPSVAQQIGAFQLAGGTLGDNDLVTVWAGANDLFQTMATANPATAVQEVTAAAATSAAAMEANMHALINAGAKNLLVFNLPDIGAAPQFNTNPSVSGLATIGTDAYNQALAAAVGAVAAANPGVEIVQVDIDAAFEAIQSNAAAYGFTDVTTACIGTATCDGFLFFDGVHPTEAGHAWIAQFVNLLTNTDTAIQTVSAIGETGVSTGVASANAVMGRLRSWLTGAYAFNNGVHIDAIGVYQDVDTRGASAGYVLKAGGARVGFDQQNGNMLLGAAVTLMNGDITGVTSSDLLTVQGDVYGAFVLQETFFVNLQAGAGFMDYGGIKRETGLPGVIAQGSTSGFNWGGSAELGAMFTSGDFALMPSARVGYSHATIDGYTESASALGMSYSDRELDAVYYSLQMRASMRLQALPNGFVFVEGGYEGYLAGDGGTLTGSLVGNTATPVTVSMQDPEGRGAFVNLGVNNKFENGVALELGYGFNIDDDSSLHEGRFRLKMPL